MRLIVIFVFIFFSCFSFSQEITDSSIVKSIDFGQHLVNSEQHREAVHYLNNLLEKNITSLQKDEINYLLGWSLYKEKSLHLSNNHLLKVSKSSQFYHKSHFFGAYNYVYLHQNDSAKNILSNIKLKDKNQEELLHFQLAGIALLERDFDQFNKYRTYFTQTYYPLAKQEKNQIEIYEKLRNYKSKKPGLAAVYSAIVPGSGKIYAGRLGDGISSFLIVSSLGVIAAENYYKNGIDNFRTIAFGSLFTVFYVGNIWGSYFSVQIQKEEFNHEMDHKILFDLHIPLRTIFN